MKIDNIYAHTPPKDFPNKWHILYDHLKETAKCASEFSRCFGYEKAGFVLGLFHDLGKIDPNFQEYLRVCDKGGKTIKTTHSIQGASFLWKLLLKQNSHNLPLSICCFGHHGGLNAQHKVITQNGILYQWWNNKENDPMKRRMQEFLKNFALVTPEKLPSEELKIEFLLRMLFSSLVDADFLDTERHFNPSQAALRTNTVRLFDLWPIFRATQLKMMWQNREDNLNKIRNRIYFSCVDAAKNQPGVFRLTVPTGGGKTLSGMAFALKHAVVNKTHGFRRIIIALPYTSIIDQNANVYREIFGNNFVLEHQSQVEVREDDDQDENYLRQRLASENWDYPIIVTTTVQLFESLFNNKPARCRKLHNIAKSILILDEIQTLPPELVEPTMDVLRTLIDDYGVTLVLSTATQPAFDSTPYLKVFDGIKITEIVPDYKTYFDKLKRVQYLPLKQYNSLDELADEIAQNINAQSLTILNTRKHALKLLDALMERKVEGLYHLSTLLCGAHRKKILKEVTEKLNSSNAVPVRLISTQVVEAGVDLDFPVVFRAIAPLDRIVQAAGRCNRNDKRNIKGKVIIFDFPEQQFPSQTYKLGIENAGILLKRNPPEKLHDPDLYTEFFQMLFKDVNLDKHNIQSYRRELDFPIVAEKYKLIENTVPVVILTYDNNEGEKRLKNYIYKPSRETWCALMPYIVNLHYYDTQKEDIKECIIPIEETKTNLHKWIGTYDEITHRGIRDIVRDPADLII